MASPLQSFIALIVSPIAWPVASAPLEEPGRTREVSYKGMLQCTMPPLKAPISGKSEEKGLRGGSIFS